MVNAGGELDEAVDGVVALLAGGHEQLMMTDWVCPRSQPVTAEPFPG